jgi:tRNA(Ile)-lysidine synthetase-like protein
MSLNGALTDKYCEEILQYWFSDTTIDIRPFWFDQSPDDYIKTTYKQVIDYCSPSTIKNVFSFSISDRMKLALLLIGDQFTRNCYRHDESQRTKHDCWALPLALQMINDNIDLTFPLSYRFFILLPLRHHKSSDMLDIVCNRIHLYKSEFITQNVPIPSSLTRFYMYTIQNYTPLTDTIVYCDSATPIAWNPEFETVLEHQVDPPNELSDTIQSTILQFSKKTKRVGVSLSGGVDSNALLDSLQQSVQFEHLVAIHIEYVNRPEARLEREYLQYYCAQYGIPLYYRTIHYMKRDDDLLDRNVFEEETKKARFLLYKWVSDKERLDGICLGHHKGDIIENILTNMIKGKDLKNVKGMSETQVMFDVTVFRPFLSLTKEVIFEYAHFFKKRYFKNTTPDWSCRGVIRNKVIPDVKKQFGDIEHNMIAFAERISFLEEFYQEEVTKKIKERVGRYGTRFTECKEVMDNIDSIVMRFMHGNGYHMASKKSIRQFLLWMSSQFKLKNKYQISKDVYCFYRNGYYYLVNDTKIKTCHPTQSLLLIEFDNYNM